MTVAKIMMAIFVALVVSLVIILAIIAARPHPQSLGEEKQINVPAFPSPKPKAVRTPPEPQIGMFYSDFMKLCDTPTRTTRSVYATGERVVYYYAYTEKRWNNRCVGYFVFEDYELVSIHSD